MYTYTILPCIGVFLLLSTGMKLGGWKTKTIFITSLPLTFLLQLMVVLFLIKTEGIFIANYIAAIIIVPCLTYLINSRLAGHVDLKEKDFILKRTFGFLFKTHTSSFVVAGRKIKKSNGIFIEIKISLSSFQLILFLLLLGSMTATVLFTSNTWEWFTQFCFIIFYVLSSLYGFKRTEDKIMWYLDKYCS